MQITTFSIHGSRHFDQRLMVNGSPSRNLLASAWASNFVPDMGTAAEVVVDYSSGTAEAVGGGVSINMIPKEGGNGFKGSFFVTACNGSFQSDNYTDELKAAGLGHAEQAEAHLRRQPAGGGPCARTSCGSSRRCAGRRARTIQAGASPTRTAATRRSGPTSPTSTKPGESRLTVKPSGEHPADLAGDAAEQVQLLGRAAEPPLDQCAGQRLSRPRSIRTGSSTTSRSRPRRGRPR